MSQEAPNGMEVMQVLWEHAELKPPEIRDRFPRPIDDVTLRSHLRIPMDKGHSGFTMLTSPIPYLSGLPRDPFGEKEIGYVEDVSQIGTYSAARAFHTSIFYEGASGSHSIIYDAVPPCPHPCGCGDPLNFFDYNSNKSLTIAYGPYPANNPCCVHAFAVFSIGPDRWRASIPLFEDWPYHPDPLRIASLIGYSPTNGSKSKGNIFSMTGNWRSGHFMLDGQVVGHP